MIDTSSIQVVAITIVCGLIGQVVKSSKLDNKWIPAICGVVGCLLGIGAFAIQMPAFPGTDWITSAAIGIASGLAATGANQVWKQLFVEEDTTSDNAG